MSLAVGLLAILSFVSALVLLRGTGRAWRVGRLLIAAPEVGLGELVAMIDAGRTGYVLTRGRISSEEEFPDELSRPLVYRRRRLERLAAGDAWETLDDERLAVHFGLEDRAVFVAVDVDALGDGLVVVPRVSTGTVDELDPERLPRSLEGLPGSTPLRLTIEQVSALEHATVAGLVVRGSGGEPMLTASRGRPLILTTLDRSSAVRLLGTPSRRRLLLAAAALAVAVAATLVALVLWLVGQ